MAQITLDIRKEYDCDVLVVGGGVTGFSAAVAAARGGARVILCENGGVLGGTATKGLVGPFMTCYDKQGKVQIIRGFFSEFVDRMIAEGGAISYKDCPGGDSYSGYRYAGHIGVTPFSAEVFKRVADEICQEENIKVLFHSTLVACDTEGDRISAAYFANIEGIDKITAKEFIDASGNASLAAKSGAGVFRGDEDGFVQTASTFFYITGVNKEVLDAYMAEHKDMRSRFFMDKFDEAVAHGEFPCGTRKLRIYENFNGLWTVNMAQVDRVLNDLDVEELSRAEAEQRAQMPQIVNFLKKYIPGLENIKMVTSASDIGIRESRKMIGKTLLTGEDIANSRYADEQIAVCANSIDIHKNVGVAYTEYTNDKNYYIPLSCLQSRDMVNLLGAGKSMSADTYAFAAVRVMPPCFAMGQAAGIAAALAVSMNCPSSEVPVAEVQKQIIANGGYLEL